jgi:hypothetical protein
VVNLTIYEQKKAWVSSFTVSRDESLRNGQNHHSLLTHHFATMKSCVMERTHEEEDLAFAVSGNQLKPWRMTTIDDFFWVSSGRM